VSPNIASSGAELPLRAPEDCTVIIVDDDDRIVEALTYILSRDRYRILSATDGHAALNLVLTEQPDVIILDVLLPGMDGIELCQQIKRNPRTHFLPVILMTGLAARGRQLDGLQAGADDFLNKPIDPLELTARVRSLIRTKQLYEEVEASRQELEIRVAQRTRELQVAYQRLQELDKVKSNILAIVAHELRTPLNKIKSGLWVVTQPDMAAEKKVQAQQTIEESLAQLAFRIADVDLFSDPSNMKIAPVSVGDLVYGALEQVRVLQPRYDQDIAIQIEDGLPPALVDATVITRALTHILDNAVKFGESHPITIRGFTMDDKLLIEVQDQGLGIPDSMRDTLFTPLSQGDGTSTRRHGGMGIGLALVKLVLDAHNGTIEIHSEPGSGTTVTVKVTAASLA
jgi:signal transduction histidine kinase